LPPNADTATDRAIPCRLKRSCPLSSRKKSQYPFIARLSLDPWIDVVEVFRD
jgi:hypothetical protein